MTCVNTRVRRPPGCFHNFFSLFCRLSVKASRPLVGFGALIDNTIKGLTYLHKIMSRNLTVKLVLKEMAHVLQASVIIPLA